VSIYRKGRSYLVRIDVGIDTNGKRRRVSVGAFRTKKEAQAAERWALDDHERGCDLSPRTATIADVVSRFVADRKVQNRAIRTIERYEQLARLAIFPHLGSKPVGKLNRAHVSDWITLLRQRGSVKSQPLSAKSVKHAFALLSAALRWAVRHDIAVRNICESIEAPSAGRCQARAFSEADFGRLIAAADATRWGPFYRLAVATAARRGELLALRWTDIDFERRTLTISRATVESSDPTRRILEKSTKTDRVRSVPLGGLALDALRIQKSMQAQDRLTIGAHFDDSGHVFQTQVGGPIRPFLATDAFRTLRTRLRIAGSLHSLRHTGATWMLANGVDVRTVSSILGHSSASTTLTVYAHVVEGHERAAIDVLCKRLSVALGRKSTEIA